MFTILVLEHLCYLIKIFIEIEIAINMYNIIVKKGRWFKLYELAITSRLINQVSFDRSSNSQEVHFGKSISMGYYLLGDGRLRETLS